MPYKVHLMGPSTLLYSDTTPQESLMGLTEAALVRLGPDVDWACSASVLYLAPGMAARVGKVVAAESPDLILLRPPDMQFLQDYVVFKVRERWPPLYRPAARLAQWLNDLAGGGPDGAPKWQGWLFRGPRAAMTRLIGVAPAMRVGGALDAVRETLDLLRANEDLAIIYSLPMPTLPPNIPAVEAQRRREAFAAAVTAYCSEKQIPCLDPGAVRRAAGLQAGLAGDRWHPDLENRRFDASVIARAIIQARDGATELKLAVELGA
jgi:hypothetical protein